MSKEAGIKLEKELAKTLEDHGFTVEMTAGSGSARDDADLRFEGWVLEAKAQHTRGQQVKRNVTINADVFDKVEQQASARLKDAVLAIQNGEKRTYAVVDFEVFAMMAATVREYNELIDRMKQEVDG